MYCLECSAAASVTQENLTSFLQTVKKDEFSTKCNQTDYHRMPGGRQEVRTDGWDEGGGST